MTSPSLIASAVKTFISKKAPTCVHEASGMLKYRFVTPSFSVKAGADDESSLPERSRTGHYLQMYDWDACFFSQAAPKLGINDLAHDVVANFLTLKEADGHIPRTVSPQRIWDAGDACKPFLCQALWKDLERQKEAGKTDVRPATFIDDLDCYLQYFERKRKNKLGLYSWRNVLESGVDDNLALIAPREAAKDEDDSVSSFKDGKLAAVDLSAYLAAEFLAFSRICKNYGKNDLAENYEKLAAGAKNAIETHCWNEDLGLYCNVDPKDGSHVKLRAWTGLAPVLFALSKPERSKFVIEKNVLSEEHFLRPAGIASLAASELLYNNAVRGLYGRAIVSNWQGPVWILTNALVLRTLLAEGYQKAAQDLALRVLRALHNDIEKNRTMHENYHAETGQALWAPDFMSWNVLALELCEVLA